jgi:hypothetical protein
LRIFSSLSAVLFVSSVCFAQGSASSDPVATTKDLPAYLRVLPKPELEPWSQITREQRFNDYVARSFSPVAVLGAVSGAAFSQALDSPTQRGQGWGAYGIRVTSSYGATLVGSTIMYGASALLHEDTRYFRSSSQGFGGRFAHVIVSPYVARNNQGNKHFSTSMFLGSAGYSGIQLAWSPSSWQGWDNVGLNYLIWYGQVAGVNLVREFYPSVVRHYRKKHLSPVP